MYKVFLNDRLIAICAPGKITINKPAVFFDSDADEKEVCEWFKSFEKSDLNNVVLLHPEPAEFFGVFKSVFKVVEAAGGVVLSDEKILFIFRRGKWDLPKGKTHEGENPGTAAIREVAEECGIARHKIEKKLPSTFHIYNSPHENEGWVFKETFWFEMAYNGPLTGVPQTEEDISEVKWIRTNEVDEVLQNTYENLKQIIGLYRA